MAHLLRNTRLADDTIGIIADILAGTRDDWRREYKNCIKEINELFRELPPDYDFMDFAYFLWSLRNPHPDLIMFDLHQFYQE
jgi:hypothetical protein